MSLTLILFLIWTNVFGGLAQDCSISLSNKKVRQSKTWGDKIARLAVDGDPSTYSVAVSESGNPRARGWWQVDLGSLHRVSSVRITSSKEQCVADYLKGFVIVVSNDSSTATPVPPRKECYTFLSRGSNFPAGQTMEFRCQRGPIVGRYLTIKRQGSSAIPDGIALAEVEVIGRKANKGFGYPGAGMGLVRPGHPIMGIIQPGFGNGLPSMGVGHPLVGIEHPGMGVGHPGMGVGHPGMGVGHPGMGVGHPVIGIGHPGMGIGQPGMGIGHPGMGVGHPGMGIGQPDMGIGHPGMGVGHPGMGVGHPVIRIGSPGMGIGQPDMGVGQPGMGVGQPVVGIGHPGAGIRTPGMGVGHPGMGVGHPVVGIGSPGMGIIQPGFGNGLPSMGVGHPLAGIAHHGMGVGHPGMGVGPSIVNVGSPSAGVGHPVLGVSPIVGVGVGHPSVGISHPGVGHPFGGLDHPLSGIGLGPVVGPGIGSPDSGVSDLHDNLGHLLTTVSFSPSRGSIINGKFILDLGKKYDIMSALIGLGFLPSHLREFSFHVLGPVGQQFCDRFIRPSVTYNPPYASLTCREPLSGTKIMIAPRPGSKPLTNYNWIKSIKLTVMKYPFPQRRPQATGLSLIRLKRNVWQVKFDRPFTVTRVDVTSSAQPTSLKSLKDFVIFVSNIGYNPALTASSYPVCNKNVLTLQPGTTRKFICTPSPVRGKYAIIRGQPGVFAPFDIVRVDIFVLESKNPLTAFLDKRHGPELNDDTTLGIGGQKVHLSMVNIPIKSVLPKRPKIVAPLHSEDEDCTDSHMGPDYGDLGHDRDGSQYGLGHNGDGSQYGLGRNGDGSQYGLGRNGDGSQYGLGHDGDGLQYGLGHDGDGSQYGLGNNGDGSQYGLGHDEDGSQYGLGHDGDGPYGPFGKGHPDSSVSSIDHSDYLGPHDGHSQGSDNDCNSDHDHDEFKSKPKPILLKALVKSSKPALPSSVIVTQIKTGKAALHPTGPFAPGSSSGYPFGPGSPVAVQFVPAVHGLGPYSSGGIHPFAHNPFGLWPRGGHPQVPYGPVLLNSFGPGHHPILPGLGHGPDHGHGHPYGDDNLFPSGDNYPSDGYPFDSYPTGHGPHDGHPSGRYPGGKTPFIDLDDLSQRLKGLNLLNKPLYTWEMDMKRFQNVNNVVLTGREPKFGTLHSQPFKINIADEQTRDKRTGKSFCASNSLNYLHKFSKMNFVCQNRPLTGRYTLIQGPGFDLSSLGAVEVVTAFGPSPKIAGGNSLGSPKLRAFIDLEPYHGNSLFGSWYTMLDKPYLIKAVILTRGYATKGQPTNRMGRFVIKVGSKNNPKKPWNVCQEYKGTSFSVGQTLELKCKTSLTGRFISIEPTDGSYFDAGAFSQIRIQVVPLSHLDLQNGKYRELVPAFMTRSKKSSEGDGYLANLLGASNVHPLGSEVYSGNDGKICISEIVAKKLKECVKKFMNMFNVF